MITPNASNCCECDHHIHHHAHHTTTAASQTNGHGGDSNRCGIVSGNVCSTRCRSILGYHPQLALADDGDAVIGVSCSETSSASGRYSPHPNELFQQHHGKLSVQPITGYDDTSNCCLPPPSPAPNSDRYIMSLTSPQTPVCGLPNNVNCLEMHTAYTNYDGDVGSNKGNANGHIHQTSQSFSSSSPTSPLDVNGISKTTLTPKYVSSLQECSISPNTRFRLPERIREVPMPKSLIMTSPSSVGSQPAYASTAVTSQPSSNTRYVSSTHFLKQNTPLVTSDSYTYLSSTVHTPVKRYVPTPPPPNELYSDISMQPTPVQQTSIKCGANINMVGVSGGGGRASTHHGSTLPYRFRMKCCTNESQPIQTTNTASSNLTHNLEHRPLSLSDYYGSSPQTRSIFVKSSHNSHNGRNSSGSNSGNNVNDNTNGAGSSKTTTASGKDSSTIILHDQQMQINGHSSAAKVHGTTSWIFSSTLAGSAAMATSVRTSTASSVAVASDNGNGTYVVGGNRLSSTNTARINKAHVINDYIQRTPSIEYINATATAAVGRLCTTTTTQMEPSSGRGTNSSTGMSSGTGSATTCLHCNTVRRTTGVHQTTQTTGPISPVPLPQMMDGSSSGIVGMNSCNSGFLKNVLDQTSLTLTPSTSASHISPLSPSGTYHSRILFPNKLDDDNLNGIEQMQHQQGDQIYLAPKSQPQPKNFLTQGIITEHVAVVGNNVGGQQQQHQAGDSGRQLLQQSLIQSQQTSLHQPQPPSPLQQLSLRRFPRKKRFSQYIRKEIARFFGIDARTEAEEFAVWQGRQRRLALRRFGALKCESELHAEIINNNPGEASNRLNCYGATGGTNQQNHNYHYHHSERPDILPTHDTENNGLPIEYSTRRCHFVYADFHIADNVERKASVSTMIISSLNYIVYSLNRRQPRNYRQWSRSFAPAHLNNINDIVNSSDVSEGLSALQEDEMFFDSTGTEQIVANENSNGGNSYNGAVGGVMRTEGPNKPANNGVKMIEYHRQIYMGERVHGWRTSAVMSGNTHCTTNNEQGIAAVLLKPASKISGTFGGQQPSNDGSYQSKKSGNVAASLPNVQFMNGTRGDRISPQLLDGVLENSRRPIQRKVKLLSVNDLDDRADHRLFFTYWINTVQIVVLLLSLICYGIGPVGIGVELKTGQVLVTSLSLQTVQHMEQRNVWIGPRNNDLVHMGAKFAICMRSDVRIMDVVLKMRRQERETACCIRNDDSGCVQSSQADCSVRGLFPTKSISTWKKWSPGDSGPGGRISGSVCGLDPKYCDSPASIAPYEWADDITKWPICRKTNTFSQRFRYKDNTAEHMACEVIGHPCCTGAYGECRITTREYCDFVNGFFHEEASLCSQISCLNNVCGMLPFLSVEVPDQFYRLFTSLCLHAGILHLAITIAFQHIFLADLERLIGPIRTAIVYIGSGLAGNLTSAVLVPYKPEVGPFASLSGVVASLVVLLILTHWKQMRKPHIALFKLICTAALLFGIGTLPWQLNFAGLLAGTFCGIFLTIALVPFVTITKYGRKAKINLIWSCVLFHFFIYSVLLVTFYVFPTELTSLNVEEVFGTNFNSNSGGSNIADRASFGVSVGGIDLSSSHLVGGSDIPCIVSNENDRSADGGSKDNQYKSVQQQQQYYYRRRSSDILTKGANTKIISMSTRKYKSGAEKRKLQLSREKEKSKCAKLHTFFKIEHKNDNERSKNLLSSEKEGSLSKENISREIKEPNTKKKILVMQMNNYLTTNNPLIQLKTILMLNIRKLTLRLNEIQKTLTLSLGNILTWDRGQCH